MIKKSITLKPLILLGLLTATCIGARAQVTVAATGGSTTGSYATLNAAFTAINAGTHTGTISITVTANTTEPATPVPLLASGTGTSSYTSVSIMPSGNVTINSAAAPSANRGVIELAGADNVTIDGDDPATAGTRNLSIVAAPVSTSGIACLRISSNSSSGADGANNISVKNCIITGARNSVSSTTKSYGIQFSNGTSTSSSSTGAYANLNTVIQNNLVTRCYYGINAIGNSSTYPNTGLQILNNTLGNSTAANNIGYRGISVSYSAATSGSAIISGNEIMAGDYGTTGYDASVAGIEIGTGNYGMIVKSNNIHDISQPTIDGYGAYGIYISGATNNSGIQIVNNFIRDCKTYTYETTGSYSDMPCGVYFSSGATGVIFNHNTIVMNSQPHSGNYASFCVNSNVSTVTFAQILNNVLVNNSASTAASAIYINSNGNISGGTVNNNDYYVASGAQTGFYNGNNYSTLAQWQAVTSKDAASISVNPPFTSATDLHIPNGTVTQLESAGISAATTGVNTDFDGQARPGPAGSVNGGGTAPDMGADEFDGGLAIPPAISGVTTPAVNCVNAVTHAVSASIVNTTGTITTAIINYNNGTSGTVSMSLTGGSNTNGTWTGTIPAGTAGMPVIWSVTATNSLGISSTYNGTGYTDVPLTGVATTATASNANSCSGNPDTLKVSMLRSGSVTIGSGTNSISSTTSVGAFYGSFFGNGHAQILFTAAELSAQGLSAGSITALSLPISALGSPATLNSFSIKMANVSATSIATFQSPAFTTVWGPVNYTPVIGTNTHTFTMPFVWDGTSNVLVDYCFSNAVTGTNSAVNTYTSTSFSSFVNYNVDGTSGTGACTSTTVNNTSTIRPNITFTGNTSPVATAYAWSNGSTTIGTTNPLVVTPATTTTYNATITAAGCTSTTNNVTVTVTPLPSAPTATNSNQCGTQVPSAAVADPNGYITPTFKWYAAATGGVALQSSASNTYTTAIAATTTFYVSVVNPATGCESNRTSVTVTVSTPDAVTAKANSITSNTGSCIGNSVSLTSVHTGSLNNYTYSWAASPATGSGIASSMSGQNVTVTPTAAGIYTYTVTAVDGSCATTSTVTDTVKDPFAGLIVNAMAKSVTACAGGADTLIAYAGKSDTATVGVQSTTELGGGVYRIGYGTGDFRHQLIYTAADLTAAGFVPGNITALAFKVTSVGSGSANNYTIKMSNVTNSTTTSSFIVPSSATTVYTAATYTPVSGMNTHTFSAPFTWDGLSNVLVDICYNISATGSSSTLAATTPAAVMNVNLLGTTGACNATTGGTTYSNRPLVWFAGNRGTAANSYSWSNGSTVVGTANPQAITPAVTTTYTATLTKNGCSATAAPVTVTVAPLSSATASATAATICAGKNDTLSVSVSGAGAPFTYSWSDGTSVVGTTQTLAVTPATTKTYTVTVTNTCGQTVTSSKTITVNPLPTAVASANAPICSGSTLNLTGTSNGANFSWTGPNSFTANSQNASVNSITSAGAGTYTFTATSAAGCSSVPSPVTVVVNQSPAAVSVTPSTAAVCAGSIQQLTAAGGSAVNQVLFSENFNGATNTWTAINNSTGGTTPAGSAWMLRPSGYTYSSTVFKSNDSTQFYISNSDTAGVSSMTNTILQSPAFSTVGATNVYVDFYHYYKAWSTAVMDSAIVEASSDGINWNEVKAFKGADRGTSSAFAHDTVYLNAYAGLPAVYVRYHFTSSFGFYWAVDNVTVRGTTSAPMTWTPATALYTDAAATIPYTAGTNATTVYTKPTAATVYTATATTGAGCTASNTASITISAPPVVTISGTSTVCAHAAGTLTGAPAGGNWTSSSAAVATVNSNGMVTGVAAGTDTVTYTVTSGCTASATKVITVNPLPVVNVTAGGPLTFCDGDSVLLTAHGNVTSYTWLKGATATAVTDSVYKAQSSGTYRVVISNSFNCVDTSAATTVVDNPLPQPVITTNGNTMSAGTFTTYQWYLNGTPISGATGSSYTATQNGSYTVAVTDANSCPGTSAAFAMSHVGITEPGKVKDINVYPSPSKGMVYFDSPVPVNVTVYAADGRRIAYSEQVNSFNMTGYAAGTYIFVITDKDNSFRVTKRILKAD